MTCYGPILRLLLAHTRQIYTYDFQVLEGFPLYIDFGFLASVFSLLLLLFYVYFYPGTHYLSNWVMGWRTYWWIIVGGIIVGLVMS